MTIRTMGMSVAVWLLAIGTAVAAPTPDSKRMGRAKDFIADEQWSRAIVELQAAAADPIETNRDEALFWLAHSQHQVGDDSSALQSIAALEQTSPKSPWVKPARSLRVEIAQVLRREDVLRRWAGFPAPPTPPVAPTAPAATPMPPGAVPRPAALPTPSTPPPSPIMATPVAAPPAPPAPAMTPPRMRPGRGMPVSPPAAPAVPPAPFVEVWFPASPQSPDMSIKVLSLAGLFESHSEQVIPLLREIALDHNNPDEARQAVFLLGQSRLSEARRTVVEVAHQGAEPVRVAAVRELGHFDGPTISSELMQVYTMTNAPLRLKRQVVSSFGERADNASLLHIVRSESETTVRDFAIVTLGRTGARDQLRLLYAQTPRVSRPAVLRALVTVKDDDELIRIAKSEQDFALRANARQQLRLLATPKAIKFLEENP